MALVAPLHIKVEVPRALQLAVRDGRVSAEVGESLLEDFLSIALPTVPTDDLVRDAFHVCTRYRVALYDALYCALAEQLGWPLLLADKRLINRLRGEVGYFYPLWDWPPPAADSGA